MTTDMDLINEENWKKAPGIEYKRGMTNSALSPRDYSVPCKAPHKIALVKGYHVWWCSAHHQPKSHCDYDKAIVMRDEALKKLSKIDDALHEDQLNVSSEGDEN